MKKKSKKNRTWFDVTVDKILIVDIFDATDHLKI